MSDVSVPLLIGVGMIAVGTALAAVIALSIVKQKRKDASFDD
jgi:hypothetical protein